MAAFGKLESPLRVACGLTRQATCGHERPVDSAARIADNLNREIVV
jgi:hypothetical protein